jgi:hypothetical protein
MSDWVYSHFMPILFEPWNYYPSLTRERLHDVAVLMRDIRNQAALLHDPTAGDGAWSFGCRVYERTIVGIRVASLSTPWLSVLPETQNLRLTFAIGPLPIKFYKGDPEDVPSRSLAQSHAELRQLRLAFDSDGIQPTHILRLAVEVHVSGKTKSISLVEIDESGSPARVYEIPLDAENVVLMRSRPIDLTPPVLEIIEQTSEDSKRGAIGDKHGASGTES